MYSEIKSNDKILINRLDENEQIILEEIYKKSQLDNTDIIIEKLTDESGDFGGVLINFIENDLNVIELKEEIPELITLEVGKASRILIDTNIKDVQPIVYCSLDNQDNYVKIEYASNYIDISCEEVCTNSIKLYYSISAEGYKTYNGIITINTIAKENQRVEITVTDGTDNITDLFDAIVIDENDTDYILAYDSANKMYIVNLPVGNYTAKIKYKNSEEIIRSSDFVIDEEKLLNPENTEIEFEVAN